MPFHVRFRAALKRKMHVFESIPSVDAAAAVSPYLVRYPSPSARRISVMPPVLPSSSTSFSNSLFSIQRFAPSLARYKDVSFARSSLSVLLSALPSFSWIFPFFFFTPYPSLTSSSLDRSVYLFSLFILSSEARLTVYGNCCTVWSGSYKAPAARLLSDGRAWRVGGRARCYFNRESGKEIWHLDKKNWTTDDEYWRSWTHTKTVRRTDEFTYCVCL